MATDIDKTILDSINRVFDDMIAVNRGLAAEYSVSEIKSIDPIITKKIKDRMGKTQIHASGSSPEKAGMKVFTRLLTFLDGEECNISFFLKNYKGACAEYLGERVVVEPGKNFRHTVKLMPLYPDAEEC